MEENTRKARFVVVAVKQYKRKTVALLTPFEPTLSTEELDAMEDEAYKVWEEEHYADFSVEEGTRDNRLPSPPSPIGPGISRTKGIHVRIREGEVWPVGSVVEMNLTALGTEKEVGDRYRPEKQTA